MAADPASVEVDLVIVGGGLVGASLALALAPLQLRIAVVEAVEPAAAGQHPSFDERTTALANGSVRVFQMLGVWPDIQREATPIRRIHVSEQGRFGTATIDASEQGLESLGSVVPNRVMGEALWARLAQQPQVRVFAPAVAEGSAVDGDRRTVTVRLGNDAGTLQLRARLVVAADGARSLLREQAGIGAEHIQYGQTAMIATATSQRFHEHVAYERFTTEGPIAVLPLSQARCGIVWTREPQAAERLMALTDGEFIAEFQAAFGFRLGRFLRVSPRQAYPLSLSRAESHVTDRMVVVGNAAQGLHPIAGQGFNLGLRDAASLAEVISDAIAEGRTDVGQAVLLDDYARWRQQDSGRIVAFTDGLVRLYSMPLATVRGLRSAALLAFDAFPPAKAAMARLSVGAAGRVPRLARGVRLRGSTP